MKPLWVDQSKPAMGLAALLFALFLGMLVVPLRSAHPCLV
jgi:hypothetical protein